MLNERMQTELNDQLNAEIYSSYLYLSMSAYFRSVRLSGFAHWMRVQAKEELAHAMKFFDYIADNGKVILKPVDDPPTVWSSPLAAFEQVLRHEKKVTGLINNLVRMSEEEGDTAAYGMLQWFVKEQEEEEESAEKVLRLIKSRAVTPSGLAELDAEMGRRPVPHSTGI